MEAIGNHHYSFAFSNMDEYNFFKEEDDYSNLDLVEVFCEEEGFQDNLDAETLKLLKNFK